MYYVHLYYDFMHSLNMFVIVLARSKTFLQCDETLRAYLFRNIACYRNTLLVLRGDGK